MWQTAAAPDGTYTVDFTHVELTDPDDCVGHRCANGGTCVDGHFSYSCDCPDNYSGDLCTGKRTTFVGTCSTPSFMYSISAMNYLLFFKCTRNSNQFCCKNNVRVEKFLGNSGISGTFS